MPFQSLQQSQHSEIYMCVYVRVCVCVCIYMLYVFVAIDLGTVSPCIWESERAAASQRSRCRLVSTFRVKGLPFTWLLPFPFPTHREGDLLE